MDTDEVLCYDDAAVFDITNPHVLGTGSWRYDVSVVYPAGVTGDWAAGLFDETLTGLGAQTDNLTNTTDDVQTVVYTFTPHINPNDGDPECQDGVPVVINVEINPQPKIQVAADDQIICYDDDASFTITSPHLLNTGIWRYDVEITYPVDVTGTFGGPSSTIILADRITEGVAALVDDLTNIGDSVRIVNYLFTPHIDPNDGGSECVNGIPISIDITMDPQPDVIPTTDSLRVCNDGTANILLTTITQLTAGIVTFDYVAVPSGPGITGYTASETGLTDGYMIDQQLTNSTDTVQSVTYTIMPRALATGCADGIPKIVEIKVHPTVIQDFIDTDAISCLNTDGTIELVLGKGIDPFNIEWNGPEGYYNLNEAFIDSLTPGSYSVMVQDNLGCTEYNSGFVSPPTEIPAFAWGDPIPPLNYNISCSGGSDGVINYYVNAGDYPPYDYWLFGPMGDTIATGVTYNDVYPYEYIDSLPAGDDYEFKLRDTQGCTVTLPVILSEPDPIVIELSAYVYPSSFNITCLGYSDGSITVENVTGGNGGYTYFWTASGGGIISGDPTDMNQTSLTAGTYYVTVTDVLGCTGMDSITLIEPEGIELVDTTFSLSNDYNYNLNCHGDGDGFIELELGGGSGSYTYEWTTVDGSGLVPSDKDQYGLTAGTYDVTVGDSLGSCFRYYSFEIREPDTLGLTYIPSYSVELSHNLKCFGDTDGAIDVTVTGGSTGNYSYNWTTTDGSGLVTIDEDQTGLTAGSYSVSILDINGCPFDSTITLTEPPALQSDIVGTDITCESPGYDNGSADLTVSGGTGPGTYSFLWSNGETTEDISNLTEGLYIVTITDLNDCRHYDSVTIQLPPPLILDATVSNYNGQTITCTGTADGFIDITMLSGTEPYIFSWTGPNGFTSTDKDIYNLEPGTYTLSVIDFKQCTGDTIIIISDPPELSVTVNKSISLDGNYNLNCYGDTTGYIVLDVAGGTGTYIYDWDDGEETSANYDLVAGDRLVSVYDENNCYIDTVITLIQPDELTVTAILIPAYCADLPSGEIILDVQGGVAIGSYIYEWSNQATTSHITDLKADEYSVLILDDNLCELRDTFDLPSERGICIEIPTGFSPNGDNINDTWRIGLIELYPDAVVEIFNRWGTLVFKSKRGYPDPWDGSYKGRILPMDSYHFVVNLHNGTKPVTGNVTIVR